MENLQTEKTNNLFNGIHYLEGDDIYIFNDGIQESEKSSKTIIISNSSNNYIIEIFNNKFLYDCVSEPDLVLNCVLENDKLVSNEILSIPTSQLTIRMSLGLYFKTFKHLFIVHTVFLPAERLNNIVIYYKRQYWF